jgi:hypothetical protein
MIVDGETAKTSNHRLLACAIDGRFLFDDFEYETTFGGFKFARIKWIASIDDGKLQNTINGQDEHGKIG